MIIYKMTVLEPMTLNTQDAGKRRRRRRTRSRRGKHG